MKKIISRFTMKPITSLFYDSIGGNEVWLYRDKYGVEYMAYSGFWFFNFRVKTEQ